MNGTNVAMLVPGSNERGGRMRLGRRSDWRADRAVTRRGPFAANPPRNRKSEEYRSRCDVACHLDQLEPLKRGGGPDSPVLKNRLRARRFTQPSRGRVRREA